MNKISKKTRFSQKSGFTLVELMVSVSLFIIIMTISMGSILSVFDANRKSQALRTVMDNLNFTLESMTRTIRFGTNYHCGTAGNIKTPDNCGNNGLGDTSLTVKSSDGFYITYALSANRISRVIRAEVGADGPEYFLTSPDVTIDDLKFRVWGSHPYSDGQDIAQPQVIVIVKGHSGTKTAATSFVLETTVSQRLFDSQ